MKYHVDTATIKTGSGRASAGILLVHGRGATAESILPLVNEVGASELFVVAPQATGRTWYPNSFMAPVETNQPYLDDALSRLETEVCALVKSGVTADRIVLLGFSQGACLTLEFAARKPRRYGAIVAFTGGLIGAEGALREYAGSLESTPIFIGAGDPDSHVPFSRIEESATILRNMGAFVDVRRYPGMGHTINQDEIYAAQELIARVIDGSENRSRDEIQK